MTDTHDIQVSQFLNDAADKQPDPDKPDDQSSFDEQVITAVDEVTTELDLPDDNDS